MKPLVELWDMTMIYSQHYYPAIRNNYGRDTSFAVCLSVFLSVCTVTDFLAGALPIDAKFYTSVRPHLRQFSPILGGIAPGMAESWASTSEGSIFGDRKQPINRE